MDIFGIYANNSADDNTRPKIVRVDFLKVPWVCLEQQIIMESEFSQYYLKTWNAHALP